MSPGRVGNVLLTVIFAKRPAVFGHEVTGSLLHLEAVCLDTGRLKAWPMTGLLHMLKETVTPPSPDRAWYGES
jgi:hypothetical protein